MTLSPKRGWSGDREHKSEKKGELMFYDYVMNSQLTIEVSRWNYYCPSCGDMLEPVRRMGSVHTDMIF